MSPLNTMGKIRLETGVTPAPDNQQRLRDEATKLGHPVPIVKRMEDGRVVHGTISPNGVIKGPIYEDGQNPEDGAVGHYRNVPWSQHD